MSEHAPRRELCGDELSRDELVVLLDAYGIFYDDWGLKGSKSLEDLLIEISEGEASLEDRSGVLVRRVDGVALDVFADILGQKFILREDRQIFKRDGTVKRRNLSTSLGEKIKRGETLAQTMVRALREELGIVMPEECMTIGRTSRKMVESQAYPGITTDRGLTHGAVVLSPDQVCLEGYVEHQSSKDSFFIWELFR